MEEEKQLQDFLNALDPELREVVNTFDTIFAPPSYEPPDCYTWGVQISFVKGMNSDRA